MDLAGHAAHTAHLGFEIQFTTTVKVMLWSRLPEVAVIVAEYVPGGVPGVVWDDEPPPPPPHPTPDANTSMTIGKARAGARFRLHSNGQPRPSKINVQARGIAPREKMGGTAAVVTDAVVATFKLADCVKLLLTCTEAGRLQVGAGLTTGAMAQLRFTVPLNDPVDSNAIVKLAVDPAFMV